MAFRHHRHNYDGNHREIVNALKKQGVEVIEIMKPVDIIVAKGGFTGFVEIKTKSRKADIKRSQVKFMAETTRAVTFAKDADEAMRFVQTGNGLTLDQKRRLAVFLQYDAREKWGPRVIEDVLAGEWKPGVKEV